MSITDEQRERVSELAHERGIDLSLLLQAIGNGDLERLLWDLPVFLNEVRGVLGSATATDSVGR